MKTTEQPSLAGIHVLLVDDNEDASQSSAPIFVTSEPWSRWRITVRRRSAFSPRPGLT
jgi:hypothetical protein